MAWLTRKHQGLRQRPRNILTRRLAREALESRVLLAVGDFIRSIDNPSTTPQPLSEAGTAVAVDGDLLAVGAPWDDAAGKSDIGQVHLYDRSDGSLLRTVQSRFPSSGGRFGHSIDLSTDLLAVATPFADTGAIDAGMVELFDAADGAPRLAIANPTPAPLDYFGHAIAIDGGRIVVGAYLDDTFGLDAGAAYVFDTTTGDLIHTLSSPQAASADYFGFSVAISGHTIVVGARRADVTAVDEGAAYLFDADSGAFLRQIANPSPENFDGFGRSAAISEEFVIVGADGDNTGAPGSGAAYVFAVSSGELVHTLLNPTPAFVEFFGRSVDISGDRIIVGSTRANEGAPDTGAAYAFSASTGELVDTLANPTPDQLDVFGGAVAIDGTTIVIGAYWDDTAGTDAGAAYVFDAETGVVTHSLPNPTLGSFNYFGYSVAVEGELVVVGAPFEDVNSLTDAGEVYLFDAGTGDLLATIANPNPTRSDSFGFSVAISGNLIVVGAYRADDGATESGIAYVFDAATGDLISTLRNPSPNNQDYFGFSVAVWNEQVIVGAYRDDAGAIDSGSVHLFDAMTGTLLDSIPNPTPDGFDYFGYSVAMSDGAVVVGAYQDDERAPNAGTVYVFDRHNTASMRQIHNPDPDVSDQFGLSVAVSGTTLAVGAPRKDLGEIDSGAVYVFHTFTGELRHTVGDAVPQRGGNFGGAIDIADNLLAVGAHRRDFPNVDGAGSVDLFDATTGMLLNQLINPAPAANDFFGWSVATGSHVTAVGTPLVDGATSDRGSVSLYYSHPNAAPFVTAGGPYVGTEAVAIEFNATGTFDDRDPIDELNFEWDFDYNGETFTVEAEGITPSVTFETDFPSRPIAVRVTDRLGLATIATTTLTVNRAAPVLTVNESTVVVDESDVATNSGSFSGSGLIEITSSVGTVIANDDGSWSWSFSTLDGPDDSQTVEISASNGLQSSMMFDLQVNNAPPAISIQNPLLRVLRGTAVANSGTVFDVGDDEIVSISASAGAVVDQGDGAWRWSLSSTDAVASQTVTITATDSDSATATMSFEVVVAQIVADSGAVNADEGTTARQTGQYFVPESGIVELSASVGDIVDHGDGTWSWTVETGSGASDPLPVTIFARYEDEAVETFTTEFELIVDNAAPTVLADMPVVAATEGAEASNTGSYTDPGGDAVVLEASLGMIVDKGDGTWSWSHIAGDGPEDSQTVTVTATDSEGSATTITFDLEVANEPPTISIDHETVAVLPATTATNTGTYMDAGLDMVTVSSSIGMIVDQANGAWSWSLPTVSIDDSQTVNIIGTDEDGSTRVMSFELVVAKIIAHSPRVTVTEGSLAEHSGQYTVAEAGAMELSASVGDVADNGDGTWSWSYETTDGPEDSQTVTITADYDNGAEIHMARFGLVVNNLPPVPTVDEVAVTVDEADIATNSGTYDDAGNDTVSLTASIGTIVDNADGTWSWSFDTLQQVDAPGGDATNNDSYTVVIEATDSDMSVASVSFSLTVLPRVVADSSLVTVDEGAIAVNHGNYIIPDDGQSIDLSASVGTIVDQGDGTWSWSYDTVDGPDDSANVTILATYDGLATFDTRFDLVVNNLAPVISVDEPEVTVADGATATNTGSFSDVGDDIVSLSASVGEILTEGDGTWSWVLATVDGPDDSQTVTIIATDSDGDQTAVTFELFDNDADEGPLSLDINLDAAVDVLDADAMVLEIATGGENARFDLSLDGFVNDADLAAWLSEAALQHGYEEAYLLGDSNLDGSVNAIDLNAMALNWQSEASGWSLGDFTANGRVNASDLNALALNWQRSIRELTPETAALSNRHVDSVDNADDSKTARRRFDLNSRRRHSNAPLPQDVSPTGVPNPSIGDDPTSM